MGDSYSRTKRMSWCIGCGQEILERFFLRVFPDLVWHVRCLKCAECHQFLHESRSCFLRDGRTFCREHGTRTCFKTCAKCLQVISSKEYVNRAGANVYHIQCFQCEFCKRALLPGDNCLLLNGHLLCTDHQEIDGTSETIKSTPHWPSKQSTTRIRTVLSEAQLCMLQTCYRANTKPDALTREQLVEMTGLSPRVIRVWFQNKRCKDKKRSLIIRKGHRVREQGSQETCLLVSSESQGNF